MIRSCQTTLICASLITVLWFAAIPASAQLVVPEVTIDSQRLPEEARNKLLGLDSVLTVYLQDQEWAGDEYDYDLEVQVLVFFTDYTPDPQEDKYKAKLIVTNKKDARLEDVRWEFGLRQPFMFRPTQYHPFTSVIEFYVWMLIGMEFDKLEKLGGRPYYDRAKQIYLESSSSIFYFGWDKRIEALRNQTEDRNNTARELSFFYYTGIYFDQEKNHKLAKDYLYYALVKLQQLPIDKQKEFLEANHRQFAEALVRAGYPKGVRELVRLDPAHKSVYDALVPEGGNK